MKPVSVNTTGQADNSRAIETEKKRLRESCREFESFMISYLMKTMRETVIRAEEPDHAREIYEDMLTGQVSKELGKGSVMGIGDMLYSKLEPLLKVGAAPSGRLPEAEGAEEPVLSENGSESAGQDSIASAQAGTKIEFKK